MIAPTKLQIQDSGISGRGVFATQNILEGEILEECHFIEMSQTDYKQLDVLKEYVFTFPIYTKSNCIVFGMGSVYNHSLEPSAYWETDEQFIALRDIAQGEEIFIDYKTTLNF